MYSDLSTIHLIDHCTYPFTITLDNTNDANY